MRSSEALYDQAFPRNECFSKTISAVIFLKINTQI